MVTKRTPATQTAQRRAVPDRSVSGAVEKLLKSLTLDESANAKAAIARALASKLDAATRSEGGAVAMATAGIAKELREVIDAILSETGEQDEFIAKIFEVTG